ncbi:helix-hairpin-helix domain-containing protein [Streptomyces sp. SID3343]|uniref:ComEA family DNA-binding protein n=1 Tax=Streptomyces sp. SID3343 TaxID=2690260 RepID=UPI0013679D45|nr:helix-hairpin-helix domain-containing protein [Streptomyces sp. SID3343]MYV98564.1 hypothetical protein [Streptomyces sp. SID3343]
MSTTGNSGRHLLAQRGWRFRHSLWVLFPILSFGLLTSVGFVIVGARARRADWWGPGVGYFVLSIVVLIMSGKSDEGSVGQAVSSALLLVAWLGGIAHAFLINRSWLRWRAEHNDEIVNRYAPRMAPAPPTSWTQGGPPPVSRWAGGAAGGPHAPSPRWAHDPHRDGPPQGVYGSVPPPAPQPLDVNTAGIGELAGLPGFDYERAGRVVTARGQQNGFRVIEDFHRAAALTPHEIAGVREHVRCSPARFGPAR